MSKVSLQELFTKQLRKMTAVVTVGIVLIIGLFAGVVYNQVYKREEAHLSEAVTYFLRDTEETLVQVENTYNQQLRKELKDFYRNYETVEEQEYIAGRVTEIKREINQIPYTPFEIKQVNYYLINPQGEVFATDYSPDEGLDLSDTKLWDELKAADPGEVLTFPLDDETKTGRNRLYTYLKLPDGNIFEIGILFKNIDQVIKRKLDYISQGKNVSLDLYGYHFHHYFHQEEELTAEEKELLKQSIQRQQMIEESISPFKKVYYRGWSSQYGNRYIKVKVNYQQVRTTLGFTVLLFLLLVMGIKFYGEQIKAELQMIVEKISLIISDIKQFSRSPENQFPIKKTDIEEIDNLIASYKKMANEINASYQQLEAYSEELEDSYQEIELLVDKLENLIRLTSELTTTNYEDERDFLSNVLQTAIKVVEAADCGSVYLFKEDRIEFIDTVGHDLSKLRELKLEAEVFVEVTEEVEIVDRIMELSLPRLSEKGQEKFKQATKSIKQSLLFGLFVEGERIGGVSLDISESQEAEFADQSKKLMEAFQSLVISFYTMKRYNQVQKEFHRDIVIAINKMLEIHDEYTRGHSENVAKLARQIAEELGLSAEEVEKTYWAGMVHDIGKTVVPREILNKKGKLTEEEFEQIKQHPVWGYDTLKNSQQLKEIALYVRHHHERWDGNGYPDGLAGDEIPLISQILTVADAWDAMRSTRPYRDSLSQEAAYQEIKENNGSQFSPRVVKAFKRVDPGNIIDN